MRLNWLVIASAALLGAQGVDRHSPPGASRLALRQAPDTHADWTDIQPDAKFTGWTRLPLPPDSPKAEKSQWSVEGRSLVCDGTGPHEWLRWDKELADFLFQAEWRFAKLEDPAARYNSGIYVRNNADGSLWHQAQTGPAGGFLFANTLVKGAPGRVFLRDSMTSNRVRPAGEWNAYEIRCEGPKITLSVNGEVTSVFDSCELPRGHVGLEAEGFRIEFRNLRVRELGPGAKPKP